MRENWRRREGGGGTRGLHCGSGDLQWYQVHMLPPGPYFLPFSFSVKEHMVQINSCHQSERERAKEGRKKGKGISQGEEQTREEEISGIAVRSEECLHFVPRSPLPHTAFKTTASPQGCHLQQLPCSSTAI